MRRTERLHALTELLRRAGARGCSAERIAAEFEVSVRTVKRDIASLERAGTPIWSRPGPHGGYGIASRGSLPPVTLSPAQAVALLTAVSAAQGAPYADLARSAAEKILDVLDPRTRHEATALAERVWVDAPASLARPVRSALEQAMTDQVVVRISYTDAGEATATPCSGHTVAEVGEPPASAKAVHRGRPSDNSDRPPLRPGPPPASR